MPRFPQIPISKPMGIGVGNDVGISWGSSENPCRHDAVNPIHHTGTIPDQRQ